MTTVQKWHINDKGNPGICEAKKKPCRFGNSQKHFSNKKEALSYIEKKLATENDNLFANSVFAKKPSQKSSPISKEKVVFEDYLDPIYFQKEQLTGNVSGIKWNSSSYREFGFTKPLFKNFTEKKFDETEAYYAAIEEHKINPLSKLEKQAAMLYTSHNYTWINSTLHRKNFNKLPETGENDDFFDGANKVWGDFNAKQPSQNLFLKTCFYLDNALKKNVKKQRRLFRVSSPGEMGSSSDTFNEDWVKDNCSLGAQFTWAGYSSTTMDGDYISTNNRENAVIFEIVASSGMNISDLSGYSEKEVLLPRGVRFVVVGNHKLDNKNPNSPMIVQVVEIDEDGNIL